MSRISQKNITLSKKKIKARFSPNFSDSHQNQIPQSFANIIPCFQFDYGIFRSQVVSKNSCQLESKKSPNQIERENPVYTFFCVIPFQLDW